MDEEIQLGEMAMAQPETSLRPDQDAHFSTKIVGQTASDDLAIFVDLDVQRDMEAHALSNTNVELGGVLMGRQFIDHAGKPFVIISDCLRATHFEATKGTFKFTHETWREITRQREEFRPDLEMVGWYHTHPDWGVFLSGMDLFICNNFFNRALDVALVIDPCKQERGWFHWTDNSPPKKRQTSGFILTTNRLRFEELEQYANFYNKEPVLNQDPRYSHPNTNLTPMVMMENRRPISDFSIAAMLVMQCIFFCFFAYTLWNNDHTSKVEPTPVTQAAAANSQPDASLSAKENAYREILTAIVSHETGYPQLVDQYTELQISQSQLQSSYQNQQLLIENLNSKNSAYQIALDQQQQSHTQKLAEIFKTHEKAKDELEKRYQQSSNPAEESKLPSSLMDRINQIPAPWYWAIFGGTGLAILAAGFFLNQSVRKKKLDDALAPSRKHQRSEESADLTRPSHETNPKSPASSSNASEMFFVGHPKNTH
ncbi:Mov34/MPN/PAD-1 family protein [Mariniblastus sp.]|nr:Mov34/MPN/PAD-1 family protein [Mariniblastus sp.]MDC3224497.1 Mov34/MPN/PAD-1 family protein [Mariniblastus sp.]